MNTPAYNEPYKFSAGALALLVHGVFFSLLYFGFNWHVKPQQGMAVEMWDHLPEPAPEISPLPASLPETIAPKIEPAPPKIEPVSPKKIVEPLAPAKADIELKERKKKQLEEEQAKQLAAEQRLAQENERVQELRTKMRAEMDAATQSEVARYKGMIQSKIKRNIVMPPDVPENAEVIFMVIVLPGGLVMDNIKLIKSSGNAAYDSAAERAIYKAQPLPMPQDAALARMFRELRLSLKP